jgi:RNA polymerase sigma factor (sigma-70 family)
MEFAELVEAIGRGDRSTANSLVEKLMPRLIAFLRIHMNAAIHDAEDCVQQALLVSLEAMQEDAIRNPDHILFFLLTTCRNNYLNLIKRRKRFATGDIPENHNHQPRQLLALLDKERHKLLEQCLQQLSAHYKSFINFWFTHPDTDAKAVAKRFDISINNAWTRKHRIIQKLNECYQQKSNN